MSFFNKKKNKVTIDELNHYFKIDNLVLNPDNCYLYYTRDGNEEEDNAYLTLGLFIESKVICSKDINRYGFFLGYDGIRHPDLETTSGFVIMLPFTLKLPCVDLTYSKFPELYEGDFEKILDYIRKELNLNLLIK